MSRCHPGARARATAAARTITTIVIALTSTIVIAHAGCADPSGIASTSKLVEPKSVGVSSVTPVAAIAADWWQGFADSDLSELVEKAVAGAPSLRVAQARVARAAANAGVSGRMPPSPITGSAMIAAVRFDTAAASAAGSLVLTNVTLGSSGSNGSR